jgi:hypothetical protein
MFLPILGVVFAGIVGGNGAPLDKQIKSVVHDAHVKPITMAADDVRKLTRHGDGTRDIITRLHVDGVIAFEIVTGHGDPSLRLVIYKGDGSIKTFSDTPIEGRTLGKDDVASLRESIADDVATLSHDAAPEPAVAAEPVVAAAPHSKARPAPHAAAHAVAPADEIEMDAPAADVAATPPTAAPSDTPSDAVSADEIAAMTGGTDSATGADSGSDSPVDGIATHGTDDAALRMRAAVGFGFASRGFTPGPTTMTGYSSTPVGAVHLDASVQPSARMSIGVVGETTVGMTSPLGMSVASTTVSRWEATASYAIAKSGAVELAPLVGLGRRAFSIDSSDSQRTPDVSYNYVIIGASAAAPIGTHVTVRGLAAFEPVISGADPMEMTYGSSSRWAFDLGGAVEVHPRAHVFLRAAAGYQRFSWSWASAGARGAGGAVDSYPSGSLSLGAEY